MVTRPCVGCGYCCKMSICPYGTWTDLGCAFLIRDDTRNRYVCGKYDEITADPRAREAPAFGTACASALFNERRRLLADEGKLLY